MKLPKLALAMSELDDDLVAAAATYRPGTDPAQRNAHRRTKRAAMAACLCAVLLGTVGAAVLLQQGGETEPPSAQQGDGTAETEILQMETDRDALAASAEELPSVSDLIVVFTPSGQETVLQTFSDGTVKTGYTRTTGTASRVLAGDLEAGETVTITEECYEAASEESGAVLWTQGGYLPMEPGETYLLFLCAYAEDSAYAGMYYPVDLEYGKYALAAAASVAAGEACDSEALEVNPYAELDRYIGWYKTVLSLYPDILS